MARIVELDEPGVRYPNSYGGYDRPPVYYGTGSSNGGAWAVLALIFLLMLVFWANRPWFTPTIETAPIADVGVRPGLSPGLSSVAYVVADNLNMRTRPNNYADVTYILPRGTRVEILGERHREADGDGWVKVAVQTLDGVQYGWVNERYIA